MTIKLPNYSNTKVLVAGDLMLDRYWKGSAQRISPEAPVPVVLVDGFEERPGGAGNVARSITALGAHCSLAALMKQISLKNCWCKPKYPCIVSKTLRQKQ